MLSLSLIVTHVKWRLRFSVHFSGPSFRKPHSFCRLNPIRIQTGWDGASSQP